MERFNRSFTYNGGKKEGLSKEFDKEGNVITLLEYHNDFLVSRERINRIDNKRFETGRMERILSKWSS